MNQCLSHRGRAFSFSKLLVAILIVSLLIALGAAGFHFQRVNSASAEVRASRQAKAFLDVMAKDFESSVSHRHNSKVFEDSMEEVPKPLESRYPEPR